MKAALLLLALPLTAVASRAASAQGAIEGFVRDSAGHPIELRIVSTAHPYRRTSTDSTGHYRLDSLPPGRTRVTMFGFEYLKDSAIVVVRKARTTSHDFVLRRDPFWIVRREERWLGCAASPGAIGCVPGRHIGSMLRGMKNQPGAWLLQDSLSLGRFWRERLNHYATDSLLPTIDWSRESVVAVSFGYYSGCGPQRFVNRIERRGDTTAVLVGPDSTYLGPGDVICNMVFTTPDVVVVPRVNGPIVFRGANPKARVPAPLFVDR